MELRKHEGRLRRVEESEGRRSEWMIRKSKPRVEEV
jgi:hypothetical protein